MNYIIFIIHIEKQIQNTQLYLIVSQVILKVNKIVLLELLNH